MTDSSAAGSRATPNRRPGERLRVLFVTSWYPTRDNPVAGVFVREHAKAVQLYDDVVLVHLAGARRDLRTWWHLEEELDKNLTDDIPTYRLWYRRSPVPKTSLLVAAGAMLGAVRALQSKGFCPDIVHANVYNSAVVALLAAKHWHVPLVLTEHWTGFPRRLLKLPDVLMARVAFRAASVAIPVSRDLEMAIRQYGIGGRFRVIPNVVDVGLFRPGDGLVADRPVRHLLFVGLLDPSHKKGIPVLLQALSELRSKRRDWHLDIVGDGPARQDYEQMAVRLGIGDKVTFHGLQPKVEVARFMREADLFVLPSLWENLPCVLVEAMASGLPIVSTTAGGIPEIVDEESAILVPPGDAVALARALDQMLSSLNSYDRQAIARKARRFSPEVVGAAIDAVYREVLRLPVHEHLATPLETNAELARVGRPHGVQP